MVGDERVTAAYSANSSFWINVIRNRLDQYQTQLTDPALLEMIGTCHALEILDAGCGEGYLARELVRRGAVCVHGVDACPELVTAAQKHPDAQSDVMRFHHADVAHLPLADNSVDLVIANRLPNGIHNPDRRFREFARVLKHGGRLVALGMHPCFYTARADRGATNIKHSTIDSYFAGRTVEQQFNVADIISPSPSVQAVYCLEYYVSMLTNAGFGIVGLREPHPTEKQRELDPWWDVNFTRPLFLLVDCKLY